jgi:uncharacterized protein (DUF58 family)
MKQRLLGTFAIITIFGVTFSYTMFQGGFVSWFLFYSILPFLLYQFVILFLPLKQFQITRELSKVKCTAGDRITVKVTLKREIPIPILFVLVKDKLHPKLSKRVSKNMNSNETILFPLFNREVSFSYDIPNVPRGEYTFEEITIKITDIFGFVEREESVFTTNHIEVYPYDRGIEYPFRLEQVQKGNIYSRNKNQQHVTSVVGVRDYVQGDRLSWVDWKASAKTSELKTKEFEQHLKQEVILCLDRTQTMELNEENLLFERAVSCTASLARSILKQGTGIGFISHGADLIALPVYYGIEQKRKIDRHLLKVKSDASRSFHSIIRDEGKKWSTGMTAVFVTTQLSENLVRQLSMLISKRLRVDLYLVKMSKAMTDEEKVLMQKLNKQKVRVEIISSNQQSTLSKGGDHVDDAS